MTELVCPDCGASEYHGCVVDLADLFPQGELIGRQLLCVGHERPYWLRPRNDGLTDKRGD